MKVHYTDMALLSFWAVIIYCRQQYQTMDWSRNWATLILIQQMTLEQKMCQNRTSRAEGCVLGCTRVGT